ncbi:MAG: RNA polymerase sigma factor [Ignavibacteriae bacterium]|nr:RNA polymerase sigma factor [Ignavibacteriota bacterium]MCB9215139.1 RNA polymerase sigma factor [Ignavibacteria bacterium]
MKEPDDIELYNRVANKADDAEEAFNMLYDRLSPHIYRYCRYALGNEALTKDVFQEVFLRFYQSIEPDRKMTNVKGFVIRIARNACLSARTSKHYGLSPLPDEIPTVDPGKSYEQQELLVAFRGAVECLPMQYREPLVLREYDGLSYQEIAELLELSLGTVKIRIYRAKQMIRDQISPALAELIEE